MATTFGISDQARKILLLRTVVAALGERANPQWWRTQFLTDVNLRILSRVFPRTAVSAALSSVVVAAQEDHDKRIGVRGRYHLFRLPSTLEHAVGVAMSEDWFRLQASATIARGRDGLIDELRTIAHSRVAAPVDGPVKLGTTKHIADGAGIEELAARYRSSFETSRRSFPYFEEARA